MTKTSSSPAPTCAPLRLFSVRERATHLFPEDARNAVVWAYDAASAERFWLEHVYEDVKEPPAGGVEILEIPADGEEEAGRTTPHVEDRDRFLRNIGCAGIGERCCEMCDLYACGIEEYAVCDDCLTCRDCRKHLDAEDREACACDDHACAGGESVDEADEADEAVVVNARGTT